MLDPRKTAAELRLLCEAVPGFEWGAIGAHNALRQAGAALQRPETAPTGSKLAFFALADYPLDQGLIELCAMLGVNREDVLARLTKSLRKFCARPQGVDFLTLENDDFKALQKTLAPALKGPGAVFALGHGFEWCIRHDAHGSRWEDLLQSAPPLGDDALDFALRQRLRAGFALAAFEPGEALAVLESLELPGFEPWRELRRADCLARLGRYAEAVEILRPLWLAMPWHPNLTLSLHNLRFTPPFADLPEGSELPPVLLYSWNKKDILAETLRSLLNTEAAAAPVFVLDNGSADGTADMLRSMAENFRGGLKIIALPVNIGAPPARNWLLALPELRRFERAVFLDDDLILPRGWLAGLMAVARRNPAAGNIGCAITDHLPPYSIQSADFFALDPQMGQRSFADLEENILMHCAASGSRETLLTNYTRPCLSVSGCCHMLKMDTVELCGAFDIRFNPSQFDDLERDIRLALRKISVWYAGCFPVRHVQHSSLRQAASRAKSAHIFGNKIKLEFLYSAAQAREVREYSQNLARMDLLRKCSQLHQQ